MHERTGIDGARTILRRLLGRERLWRRTQTAVEKIGKFQLAYDAVTPLFVKDYSDHVARTFVDFLAD